MRQKLVVAALGASLLLQGAAIASADDAWNPFKQQAPARKARQVAPPVERDQGQAWPAASGGLPGANANGSSAIESGVERQPLTGEQPAPWAQAPAASPRVAPGVAPSPSVQRGELEPVVASDGSGLALDRWQGLDPARLQELIAPLSLPPRSPALADLWRRLWSPDHNSEAAPGADPENRTANATLTAVRIEALYRSGMLTDLTQLLRDHPSPAADPVTTLLIARSRILLGDIEIGCPELKAQQRHFASVPKPLRHELLLIGALCGAADRDPGRAGLAADLLRSEGISSPVALAALDSISAGAMDIGSLPSAKSLGLLEYRFLGLAGSKGLVNLVQSAEPALLSVVATTAGDTSIRISAAERALAINAIKPPDLAAAYRASRSDAARAGGQSDQADPNLKRAELFAAVEAERNPTKRARLVRTLLDEIRRTRGSYLQAAAMLGPSLDVIRPAPEVGWFAETAIELALAAQRYDAIRPWIDLASPERGTGLRHWLVLADIADPGWRGRRGEDLLAIEQIAVRGRLSAALMHRLVTVLDALDYQIPLPLWEAASRTPQPSSGHLPDTGVLTQLQEEAAKREHARVVLTALRALGPDDAETAHIISLGDSVRALKRAGLETDARRLALESVFTGWPRSAHD